MAIRAYLYDFHGVIVDSERQKAFEYYRAVERIKRFPLARSFEDYVRFHPKGLSKQATCAMVSTMFQLTLDEAMALPATRTVIKNEDSYTPPLFADCLAHLCWAKQSAKTAVVSLGDSVAINDLIHHYGLANLIDVVVTSDGRTEQTRKRELWKQAATHLNVAASECLVIDDTLHGVNEAKLAGFYSVTLIDRTDIRHCSGDYLELFNRLITHGRQS